MKKLLLGIAVALVVIFAATVSFAGDYHSGNNMVCADCHTMHYSRAHDLAGNEGNAFTEMGPGGPFHALLRDEPNKLCLMCHDGQTDAPDVLGDNTNSYDRSAGALNDTAGTDGYATWAGHTLGATTAAPGGTFVNADGLACTNCHHQHGSAGSTNKDAAGNIVTSAYRNLRTWTTTAGGRALSYSIGDPKDLTKDVWEAYGHGATLAQHYGQDNIGLLEPNTAKSGMADYCKNCHTNFHGDKGDALTVGGDPATGWEWLRHPNADTNIGAQSSHGHSNTSRFNRLYRVRVMSATGDWGTQGAKWTTVPTDLTPTCLTCHKGHGNNNAFGLVMADGTAPLGEDGNTTDSRMTCTQCHVQGGNAVL